MEVPKKLKIELPYDPEILLLELTRSECGHVFSLTVSQPALFEGWVLHLSHSFKTCSGLLVSRSQEQGRLPGRGNGASLQETQATR